MWIGKLKNLLVLLAVPLLLSCARMSQTPRADWYVGEFVYEGTMKTMANSKMICTDKSCDFYPSGSKLGDKDKKQMIPFVHQEKLNEDLAKLRLHAKWRPSIYDKGDFQDAKSLFESNARLERCVDGFVWMMPFCATSDDPNASKYAVLAAGARDFDCATSAQDRSVCNFAFIELRRVK